MNELDKFNEEERKRDQDYQKAQDWMNKNWEIVKGKLGRRFSNDKLVALWKQETQSQPRIKNLWEKEIDKDKIYTALSDNYMDYSGKGKPIVSMKNALYIFKALHKLKLIKDELIKLKLIKDELIKDTWYYDFILSEFQRKKEMKNQKEFNGHDLKQGKKYYFENKPIDNELLKDIQKIIKSALKK